MNLSKALFATGALMISYDLAGHLGCLLARTTGARSARLWNTWAHHIWPTIPSNTGAYDAYWSIFFTIALALMVTGYALKR